MGIRLAYEIRASTKQANIIARRVLVEISGRLLHRYCPRGKNAEDYNGAFVAYDPDTQLADLDFKKISGIVTRHGSTNLTLKDFCDAAGNLKPKPPINVGILNANEETLRPIVFPDGEKPGRRHRENEENHIRRLMRKQMQKKRGY